MLETEIKSPANRVARARLADEIARLAAQASIEINVPDERYLEESRSWLPAGTRVYVSHLPRQHWSATVATCEAVRRAGFEPVPHVPVRLLESQQQLAELLAALRQTAMPAEALLISGDYPQSLGPYQAVAQVLMTGLLEKYGLKAVSIAGHPEGHPKVALDIIRDAEEEKIRIATEHGLETRMVTQFLFESNPFVDWVNHQRQRGLQTQYVCGLAGPAKISTLMRYALRCGVGPSIRALGSHGSALKNILGDHGPDRVLRELATVNITRTSVTDGIHLFCFGGFLRTAKWLSRVASCDFELREDEGFDA